MNRLRQKHGERWARIPYGFVSQCWATMTPEQTMDAWDQMMAEGAAKPAVVATAIKWSSVAQALQAQQTVTTGGGQWPPYPPDLDRQVTLPKRLPRETVMSWLTRCQDAAIDAAMRWLSDYEPEVRVQRNQTGWAVLHTKTGLRFDVQTTQATLKTPTRGTRPG